MIVAATGHRPDKLGGYSATVVELTDRVAERALTALLQGPDPVRTVISGMALGWDQSIARAAVALKIPFIAAVPFDGQDFAWPPPSRAEYKRLLALASKKVIVSPGGYSASKMQTRNEWMVDNAHRLLALWNGTYGGTKNCIEYAKRRNVPITNVWNDWLRVTEPIV